MFSNMYYIQIERGVLYYAIKGRRSKEDIPHHDESSADDIELQAPADDVNTPVLVVRRWFGTKSYEQRKSAKTLSWHSMPRNKVKL